MLVFEPDDHTALKSVIISDRPSTVYPSTVHVIARLRDSCYFQSLFSPDPPLLPSSPSFYHQVIVIMNREMIGSSPRPASRFV